MNLVRLLFAFALVCPEFGLAQATTYGDFKIVNTEIIYQKVFEQDSTTLEKLESFLKGAADVSNVERSGASITASLADLSVDYKKFSFAQVGTPPIIQTGRFSGKITAEAKDNKYRITVEQITMKGDIGYKKIPDYESMTNYACMNSATILSRDWCRPNMLGLLDQAFTDRFTYQEENKTKDW
jgi:hypothetical protein